MNNENELIDILRKNNGWTTTNTLISSLHLSVRTIRTLIKNINSKNEIIVSSKKGYKINDNYVKKYDNNNSSDIEQNISSASTSSARQELIIKKFLISNNTLDFYDLAESLFIGESTLNNDLVKLRKKLKYYDISLYKKNSNIIIVGNETNIRKLFSDNIYSEIHGGLLNTTVINRLFPDYDINSIKNITLKIVGDNSLLINDFGTTDLLIHICIMLDRVHNKQTSNIPETASNNLYYFVAKEIILQLSKFTNMQIPDSEITALEPIILFDTRTIDANTASYSNLEKYVSPETIQFVKFITQKVFNQFSINLNTSTFLIRFSLHLEQILKYNYKSNKNPLMKSIKDSYPLVFEVSVFIADLIHKKYPTILLDDHDISYIALHVGLSINNNQTYSINIMLILPNYSEIRQNYISQLKDILPSFAHIIGVINDEIEIPTNNIPNLILSTQPIIKYSNIDNIIISPIISNHDKSIITQKLNELSQKHSYSAIPKIISLFDKDCFIIIDNKDKSKNYIIDELCALLYKTNYASTNFKKDVYKRESMSSTAYSNIAIPHTISATGMKTGIAVAVCKNYIKWDDNYINIVLLLSVANNEKEQFKLIFSDLINCFTSELWKENYNKINNFQQFISLIIHSTDI